MSFLGRKQPEIYGSTSAREPNQLMMHAYRSTCPEVPWIYYTNIEGEVISRIYQTIDEGYDGLLMNPAGFQYGGYALRD